MRMRPRRGLLRTEKRKKKLERDIEKTADLIKGNKNRIEYMSSLMKEITDYISYMESIIIRFEGNFGLEGNIIQTIYKTLNELKRTVSMTLEILENVPESISARIKEEIENLNKFIQGNFATTLRNERRVYRGRSPRTHLLEKTFGSLHRDVDIYREVRAAGKEEEIEQEEEVRFRQEVESLRHIVFTEPQFQEDAIRIFRYYRREFQYLFKSLWDIQEEEAKNISLLEHYIGILGRILKDKEFGRARMEYELKELHQKLLDVEAKLKLYIRRDYGVQLNLDRVFEEFENRFEKIENNLGGIEKEPLNLNDISGQIYFKKINGKYPKVGIVFVPGTARPYTEYEPLIYRLVLEGYMVCGFDLPSQGSKGHFRIGLASEYLYNCVRYIRQKGVTEVGVIGHSLGAMTALHALAGYNEKLENYLIEVATNYIENLKSINDRMEEDLNEILREEHESGGIELNVENDVDKAISLYGDLEKEKQAFEELKKQIFEALKATRFSGLNVAGKIDAVVLLASPETIQTARAFPGYFHKTPVQVAQLSINILEGVDRFLDRILKRQIAIEYKLPSARTRDLEKVRSGVLQIKNSEWRDFLNYSKTASNPFDFMSLLDYFSRYSFVEYFTRRFIREVPKFFLYGNDFILAPSIKKGTLEKAYRTMMGPTSELTYYPDQGHLFKNSELGPGKRTYVVTSPKVHADILKFLRKHLNPNVWLWRDVPEGYKKSIGFSS